MADQPLSTDNSGLLKDYYDSGRTPLAEALKRKRQKLADTKFEESNDSQGEG